MTYKRAHVFIFLHTSSGCVVCVCEIQITFPCVARYLHFLNRTKMEVDAPNSPSDHDSSTSEDDDMNEVAKVSFTQKKIPHELQKPLQQTGQKGRLAPKPPVEQRVDSPTTENESGSDSMENSSEEASRSIYLCFFPDLSGQASRKWRVNTIQKFMKICQSRQKSQSSLPTSQGSLCLNYH